MNNLMWFLFVLGVSLGLSLCEILYYWLGWLSVTNNDNPHRKEGNILKQEYNKDVNTITGPGSSPRSPFVLVHIRSLLGLPMSIHICHLINLFPSLYSSLNYNLSLWWMLRTLSLFLLFMNLAFRVQFQARWLLSSSQYIFSFEFRQCLKVDIEENILRARFLLHCIFWDKVANAGPDSGDRNNVSGPPVSTRPE